MRAAPLRGGHRPGFPPPWAVPILLIAANIVIVLVGTAFGWVGLVVALGVVWWLMGKGDAYLRNRDSDHD
jgi:hypothetical protein